MSIMNNDSVRFHTLAHGWRFGVVIGTHYDALGIGATGLQMATVRFPAVKGECHSETGEQLAIADRSVPAFLLELCTPRNAPVPGVDGTILARAGRAA